MKTKDTRGRKPFTEEDKKLAAIKERIRGERVAEEGRKVREQLTREKYSERTRHTKENNN